MRLPNRSRLLASLLGVAALATCGVACEKNVQEVRRPGKPRDPYAAIRGAPMGFSNSPNTGVRGTPTAFGSGHANVNAGSRNAPSAPSARPRAIGGAVNPGGRENAAGSPTAYSPTDGTRARVPGAAGAETPTGTPRGIGSAAPTAIGGAAWSPTDRR